MWEILKQHMADPIFVASIFVTAAVGIIITAWMRHLFGGSTPTR